MNEMDELKREIKKYHEFVYEEMGECLELFRHYSLFENKSPYRDHWMIKSLSLLARINEINSNSYPEWSQLQGQLQEDPKKISLEDIKKVQKKWQQ